MANGIKQFRIQINGLTESTSAVDALNKQLDALEQKINKINTMKVSSGGSGSGSRGSNTALSQEEATQREINRLKQEGAKLDAKISAAQTEVYKRVEATKDLYKETIQDQRTIAAQERLTANAYSSTMSGMKQHLADLKSVINTTDLGDTDLIKKMTEEANQLTNKLKEMEEAYGQYGRNVGNYRNSIDGIRVVIAGTTKEYSSAREAMRAMREELTSLTAAEKGQTEYAKQLRREYNKLKSAMEDATKQSKFLDEAMDLAQSFTGLQQISRGFSMFFGIDNSEIEKQIARLVALQNALQGLQTLQRQIDSEEGIGKWLAKGSRAVDTFVMKVTGAQKRMGVFVAETRAASVAVNMFSKALKGIGAIALTGGLLALTSILGDIVERLSEWVSGGKAAAGVTDILTSEVEKFNAQIERNQNNIKKDYFNGYINSAEMATRSTDQLVNQILVLLDNIGKLQRTDFRIIYGGRSETEGLNNALNRFEGLGKEIEYTNRKSKDWWLTTEALAIKIKSLIKGTGREYKMLGETISQELLGRIQTATAKANDELSKTGKISESTSQEIIGLKELLDKPVVGSLFDNVDKFSEKGQYYVKQINSISGALDTLAGKISDVNLSPDKLEQLKIDAMADSEAKIRKQTELNRKKEIADTNFNPEYAKLINAKYKRELDEKLKAFRKSKKQEADQMKDKIRDAQREIDEFELELMREGLAKQIKVLENERKEKLQAIADSGIKVLERSKLAEAVYDKKLLELKRDWAHEMEKIYEDMYSNIETIERNTFEREVSNAQQSIENKTATNKQSAWQGVINPENPNNIQDRRDYYQKILEIDLEASRKQEKIRQENLDKQLEYDKKEEERRHKAVADAKTIEMVMSEMANIPNPSDADYDKIEKKLQGTLSNMKGELVEAYNEGKLDFKNFVELIEKEQEAHNSNMNSLEKEYNVQSLKNINDGLEAKKTAYSKYYTELLSSIRTQQDDVSRVMAQQPVRDKAGWGVVNIKQTRQNYNFSEDAYNNIAKDIVLAKQKLKDDLKADNITAEDFFMKNSELDAMKKSVDDALKDIKEKQKNLIGDFIQSIQQYVHVLGQSINTLMDAIWDYQDYMFDKEQDELDKWNEELDKKLDKQQEIVEEHKNNIESIEDELANARGDRRQHLIDQLNAEIAAQREAAAEEKRIQKQKEAAEKKQEQLEKKRRKQEYDMKVKQAFINWHLSIASGLATEPFMPLGIAMGALATVLGAAQYALVKSQKPYAHGGQLDGGVAQGPRHSQGGIPVLGGRASIEGGEFITNRVTTAKNVELLDFINSKKKRVNLDDLIDFYGTAPKKAIKSVKTRFEDGGVVPTLANGLDISEQLQNIVVNQDNRPIVVSVVDINNKQAQVRKVKTLAGLGSE